MNQVLILTKNILAEQEIQQKLQALNYEVYCSTKLFEQSTHQQTRNFFQIFHYIVLSESICEAEVTNLVPILKKCSVRIIRKVETQVTETDHKYLEENFVNAIISNNDSADELRECLYSLKTSLGEKENFENGRKIVQLSERVSFIRPSFIEQPTISPEDEYQFLDALHHLSRTEVKILSILIEADGRVVTREAICHEVWEDKVNKSHLASLSSTITRIKSKFEQTSLAKSAIQTLWGKGYRVNAELLGRIQKDDTLKRIIASEL